MNKQTRLGKNTKPNFCVRNNGDHPLIAEVQHGKYAFQDPATAVARKKAAGSSSWRVTGRHPAQNASRNNTRK